MSLCPHSFVRSRLTGLSSTQCRSPWHRSLRESSARSQPRFTRSYTSATGASDLETYDLISSTPSQSPSTHHAPQSPQTPETEDRERLNSNPQSALASPRSGHEFRARTYINKRKMPKTLRHAPAEPLSKTRVRRIIYAEGLNPNLAHGVFIRLQAELGMQKKPISNGKLWNAVIIRATSIYSRELGLRQWKAAFGELYRLKRFGTKGVNETVFPSMNDHHRELLEKVRTDCHGSFRDAWLAMSRQSRAEIWQRLALWLLRHEPKRIPEFLLVTMVDGERPDMIMVAGCLRYIDVFYYADWVRDWRHGHHTYQSLIETCLHPATWPVVSLSQRSVHLYIKRAGYDALAMAFRMTKERESPLAPETLLSFMYRFIEQGDVDRALAALERIQRINHPHFTMNSKGVRRHICKLLTLDTVEEYPDGRNFRILPRLLEMGVRPDQSMMNIVLSNAYNTGDHRLGADMLQFMRQSGHRFDSYTYLTLLSDALVRGDRGRVNALINEIEMNERLCKNPYLASKIFHAHYVFIVKSLEVDGDPQNAFYSMLDFYCRVHDITPLKQLSIVPPDYISRKGSFNVAPLPSTIYIMVATYFRCQKRLSNVQRVYARFRELTMQGHPAVASLVETDHIYNEFLVATRGNPRGLRLCVQVVQDMLHPPLDQVSSVTGKALAHAKPTIRTWTLLLGAFLFSRHAQAGERIKEMMAKHNVKYDHVVWNVIINGYANAQKVPETAIAIKQMEQAGYPIDSYTMKCLRYLRDPDRLWVAIDELDHKAAESNFPAQMPEPAASRKEHEDQVKSNPSVD